MIEGISDSGHMIATPLARLALASFFMERRLKKPKVLNVPKVLAFALRARPIHYRQLYM